MLRRLPELHDPRFPNVLILAIRRRRPSKARVFGEGQGELGLAAFPHLGFDPDMPAVKLDRLLDDGEPYAGARVLVALVQPLKDDEGAFEMFFWDPDAVVLDGELREAVAVTAAWILIVGTVPSRRNLMALPIKFWNICASWTRWPEIEGAGRARFSHRCRWHRRGSRARSPARRSCRGVRTSRRRGPPVRTPTDP